MTGSDLLAAAVGALVGLLAVGTPWVLARLPEPELATPEEAGEDSSSNLKIAKVIEKPLYADLARTPRLGLFCAIAGVVAGAVLGAAIGWDADLLVALPLVPAGVALTYVDWRTTYLPTRIIGPLYPVLAVAVLLAATIDGDWDSAKRAALGWAGYGGILVLLWLTGGYGYGDVRLAGVLGIALGYLGWAELMLGFTGGLLLGAVGGLLLVLLKVVDKRRSPFGPWMLIAAWLAAAFGPQLATALGY